MVGSTPEGSSATEALLREEAKELAPDLLALTRAMWSRGTLPESVTGHTNY